MLLNIVLGFVLPWIFGAYLYRKTPLTVLAIAPFAAVVSFLINAAGFGLEWWNVKPPMRLENLSVLPFNIGLYPVLACWCTIFIQRYGRSVLIVLLFTLSTTLLEGFGVAVGYVSYANGWNFAWTFCSYLVAYVVGYQFYRILRHVLAKYGSNPRA